MPRYSQGNPLKRSIMHVIIYEAFNASGGIAQPGSSSTTSTPQTLPTIDPVSTSGLSARVKADVTWGLNIRSSIDTSSPNNIVVSVPAGTLVSVPSTDDYAKIGGVNQWVRVRDNKGHDGFAAAWYLEKIQTTTPVVETVPAPTPKVETPKVPSTPTANQLIVVVKSKVGKFGVKVYETESIQSHVVATEKVRAKLVVIEDQSKARPKIGKARQMAESGNQGWQKRIRKCRVGGAGRIIFRFREEWLMLLQDNLQGLQHLGIPVTNLERSKDFYAQLGFIEAMRTDIQPQTEVIRVAMMQHENFTIELYQLGQEDLQEIAKRADGHIDHVALNVLDIEQAYLEIKAAGLEILEDNAPVYLPFWEHGVKYFTVRGPDGEKIEFNQILR